MPPAASTAVLIERLEAMQCTLQEVRDEMRQLNKLQAEFEKRYTIEHQRIVSAVEGHQTRLERLELSTVARLENDVKQLTGQIAPILFAHKILVWVGGLLGGSVVALIWALIIGTVKIVTP